MGVSIPSHKGFILDKRIKGFPRKRSKFLGVLRKENIHCMPLGFQVAEFAALVEEFVGHTIFRKLELVPLELRRVPLALWPHQSSLAPILWPPVFRLKYPSHYQLETDE